MAKVQFSRGINEKVVADVRLTRSRSGQSGTATFLFKNPLALSNQSTEDVTGMYMIDEEGEIVTREVKGIFVNGQPEALEATYIMRSEEEWARFIRFMERYAKEHDLEFNPT